jgi:excisionase family DNA binding protein
VFFCFFEFFLGKNCIFIKKGHNTTSDPKKPLFRRKAMENSKFVTPEELSQILGISEFTIRKLAHTDELPCLYVKRRILFDFDALVDYLHDKECAA